MQRRQLLKLLVPISLVAAGLAVGVSRFTQTACDVLGLPALLNRLKPLSDDSLGKKIIADITANDLQRFNGLCEENFDEDYRALVAQEFGEGKTKSVDGWILSETEIITHRFVTSHQATLLNVPQDAAPAP